MKTKKKMNSYVKILMWMCVGGFVGGCIGFVSGIAEDGIGMGLKAISGWFGSNVLPIMWILAGISLVVCLLSYQKVERDMKKMNETEDEETQDQVEYNIDLWSSFGITFSGVIICLALVLFSFSTSTDARGRVIFYILVPFLLVALITTLYQVAAVKQMRRKDPMKKGDAADLSFQKDWLESCDEAERTVIYQSSYQTFNLMKIVLITSLVIAMLGQLFWATGMLAVILIGACYAALIIGYTVNSLKLHRTRLNQ